MAWIKRKLRGNKVFVRVDDKGEPVKNERGLVDVIYKLNANAKIYRASPNNLVATGDPADEQPFESSDAPALDAGDGQAAQSSTKSSTQSAGKGGKTKSKAAKGKAASIPDDAIIIWTDGACSGNPGPMGIGAVIIDGDHRDEISEYLGTGTNNIAELTAILRALQKVPTGHRKRPVVVHSDSTYSIGLLDKGWKAKANKELVAELRALTRAFPHLRFIKVKGHAGIPENERCDELATTAITDL